MYEELTVKSVMSNGFIPQPTVFTSVSLRRVSRHKLCEHVQLGLQLHRSGPRELEHIPGPNHE